MSTNKMVVLCMGATGSVGHVEEAVLALNIQLSDEEIQTLEKPYITHPVSGMM